VSGEPRREAPGRAAARAGAREAADGLRRIEGYLLAEREKAAARSEAEKFADRLPWLLTAQREELVCRYAEARTELARRQLAAVAERCSQLRTEYEQRYRALRLRLIGACAAALAGLVLGCVTVLLLLRGRG
jgi:hypothetical protein